MIEYFTSIIKPLAAIFAALCAYRIISHLRDPLREIPGPFLGRFTRLWLIRDVLTWQSYKSVPEYHRKYGPVIRVAPNMYSIADLDVAREIYGARSNFDKADYYSAFTEPHIVSLFSRSSNKESSHERRKYNASWAVSNITTWEHQLDRSIRLLAQRFREHADSKTPCNVAHWFRLFIYDSTSGILYGKDFNILRSGHDQARVLEYFNLGESYGALVGLVPWLHRWIFTLMPTPAVETAAKELIEGQVKTKTEQHRAGDAPNCLVDNWLAVRTKNEEEMSIRDMINGATSTFAGSETLPYILSIIIHMLCKYPQVKEKLQREVDSAMKRGSDMDAIMSFDEAKDLPYLNAVIQEALRLYPVPGSFLPRRVPKGGAMICGHFFKEGVSVGLNYWAVRTDPKYFGEDAASFRPERWLGTTEKVKELNYYHIPFLLGARTCPGKHIATAEMFKCIAHLVHKFEFGFNSPSDSELKLHNRVVMDMESQMCTVSARLHGHEASKTQASTGV